MTSTEHPITQTDYFVWEDDVEKTATIHVGSCSECRNGRGKGKGRNESECRWHGACATLSEAELKANETKKEIRYCRHQGPCFSAFHKKPRN